MKKSSRAALSHDEMERLVSLATEQRKPFEAIKEEFGVPEKEVIEIMRNRLPKDKFELWRQKAAASKPKPKPVQIDDFDEELGGKYYINKRFD